MNAAWLPMLTAASDGWAQAMGRAAVQSGLAVLLVWAVCRLMPSLPGAARCWLWRLVYLRLLLALCWPHALELPLLPAPSPTPIPHIAPLVREPAPPVAIRTLPAAGKVPAAPAAAITPAPPIYAAPLRPLWLAGLWLVGMAWCVVRIGRQCRRAARLRAQSVRLEDERILSRWESLCKRARIRRAPELRCLEGLDGPMLLGGIRPLVALPAELLRDWPPEQLELALAHELAHVKRADLLWSWLPALAHVGFYFHPLFWLAAREWRLAQELACDALALRLARSPAGEYAAMLVRLAHRRSHPTTPAIAGALWAASESPDCLRRRLQAMKNSESLSRRRAALYGGAVVLLAGVLLAPFRVVAQPPVAEARDGAAKAAPAEYFALERAAAEASSPDDSRPISLEMSDASLSHVIQVIQEKSNARIVFDDPEEKLGERKIKFLSIRKRTVAKTVSLVCKAAGAYFRRDKEGVFHLSSRPYEEETPGEAAIRPGTEAALHPLATAAASTDSEPHARVVVQTRSLLEQARRAVLEEDLAQRATQQAEVDARLRALDEEIAAKRQKYRPEHPGIQALQEARTAAIQDLEQRRAQTEAVRQALKEIESREPTDGRDEAARQDIRSRMLRKKLAEIEERLARLRVDFTSKAPEVQALQQTREFLAAQLQRQEAELRRSEGTVDAAEAAKRAAEAAARQAEEARLAAQRAAMEARLRALDADLSRLRQVYTPESARVQAAQAAREAVQQALREREVQLEAARQALKQADEKRFFLRDRARLGELSDRARLNRQREAARKQEREALSRQWEADRERILAPQDAESNLQRELDALEPEQREALVRKLQRIPEQLERSFREAQRSLNGGRKRLDEAQRRRLLDELQRLQERIRAELSQTLGREVPGAPAEKEVR